MIAAIEAYEMDEGAHANQVRALKGVDGFRLRVGDFRVLFSENEAEIVVTAIGPRGGIYR